MPKTQIEPATLIGAIFAVALGLMLLPGPFGWLASLGGLALLLLLLSYDQEGYRSWFQSVAFSAVCSLCCVLASGAYLQFLAARGEVHLTNGRWSTEWLPIGFVFATAIFLGIDRIRMSSREPLEMRQARQALQPPPGFIPRTAYVPVPPPPAPETVRRAERPPSPQPTYVEQRPPEAVPVLSVQEPPQPRSAPPEPVHADAGPSPPAASPEPARAAGSTLIAHPPPAPPPPRPIKEAMIYVSLLGEGLNVLRTVKAEHLGRDFYRIIEDMPEGETWEFQPGQVVRCKKKNLSGGKAMVAIEEAPKAHA